MTRVDKKPIIYTRSDDPCHVAIAPPEPAYTQRTVVVLGNGRGGTSAIAGVINNLGIPLVGLNGKAATPGKIKRIGRAGHFNGLNVEDERIVKLSAEVLKPRGFLPATRRLIQIVEERNQAFDNWGWKDPESLYYLEAIASNLRNPLVVFVVRNAFEVAWSNKAATEAAGTESSIEQCMNWAMEKYSKMWGVLLRLGAPVLMVSYERAMRHPRKLAESLSGFLRITPTPQQFEAAVAWMNLDGGYNRVKPQDGLGDVLGLGRQAAPGDAGPDAHEEPAATRPAFSLPTRFFDRQAERQAFLTRHLDKARHRGLEMAPFYNGLVPRREGWNTINVDYLSTDELVKLAEDSSSLAMSERAPSIEEVDVVWRGGRLHQVVRSLHDGDFDFVIASHVIEHLPNLLGFLLSVDLLLKPGGRVRFAVPDLRFTFDFFQNPSTLGQMLLAERLKIERPLPEHIFDVATRNAVKNGEGAWLSIDATPVDIRRNVDSGWLGYRNNVKSADYSDCHCWFFTPASFELIMLELRQLGITSLVIDNIAAAEDGVLGSEFLVEMTKDRVISQLEANDVAELVHQRREYLLRKIVLELAERVRQLPDAMKQPV